MRARTRRYPERDLRETRARERQKQNRDTERAPQSRSFGVEIRLKGLSPDPSRELNVGLGRVQVFDTDTLESLRSKIALA